MNNHIYLQLISLNKKHTKHYLKRYVKLVSFFKERNWSETSGLHEHHIIPESFGGLDTNENLVFITIREHFILHWMLYKAFPKSSMVTAFNMMCNCWGKDFRITSKVYANVMLEFSERQSETTGQRTRKLVAEGKHHFQDKEKQRQIQKNQLKNGTHSTQIKKLCEHCNKEFAKSNFSVWHGDNCKLNPLFKPKPKILCKHCNKEFDKLNYKQHHGHKCKLNPLYKEEKIECPHCKREFDIANFSRWHGDKCKLKPI